MFCPFCASVWSLAGLGVLGVVVGSMFRVARSDGRVCGGMAPVVPVYKDAEVLAVLLRCAGDVERFLI